MTDDFWKDKIRAFLHDPPDKVIILSGEIPYSQHEKRVTDILQTAGLPRYRKDRGEGRLIHKSDLYASSLQRIDLEKSKDGKKLSSQFYKVYNGTGYVYIGEPVLRHPITGEPREFCVLRGVLPQSEPLDRNKVPENQYRKYEDNFAKILEKILQIERVVFAELVQDTTQKDYLRLWACYPSKLREKLAEEFGEELAEEFINLPAYSLAPDHSLFDHADVTTAIYGMTKKGAPALLLFKLSPVQGFIKNARKERDLWAGSHMLAYLTFKVIEIVIERYGPDAVLYPHLRDNPFFEAYLRERGLSDKWPEALNVASLPNKFLALVPWEDVGELKKDINKRIHKELREMFDFAWESVLTDNIFEDAINRLRAELEETSGRDREKLKESLEYLKNLRGDPNEKQKLMDTLLNHFTVTVTAIPINTAVPSEKRDKEKSYEELKEFVKSLNLPKKVEEKYLAWLDFLGSIEVSDNVTRPFDLYSLYYEFLVELNAIESAKFKKPKEESGWKCTLCGEHLAVGGEDREVMRALWHAVSNANPSLIKDNEYLCPVCLVKRVYPMYLKNSKRWCPDPEKSEHCKDAVPQLKSVSEVAMRKMVKGETTWTYVASCVMNPDKECTPEISPKVTKLRDVLKNLLFKVYVTENWEDFFDVELFYTENLRDERAFLKTLGIKREHASSNLAEDLNELKDVLKELYDDLGEPPKYYSILMMDGDRMGTLLMGDDMRTADGYLHPRVLEFVSDNVQEKARVTKRLITPSTHAAISRSLKNFSVNYATRIIEDGKGELIYAGGDDILALLPTDTAFSTALKLEETFSTSWDEWTLLPGRTMSAGLLIVHYKHPLYDALDRVRTLEGKAKRLGRNALTVGYLERSGSYYEATLGWEGLQKVKPVLRRILQNESSKRFIYHIFEEIDGVPPEKGAIKAFLKFESIRHLNGDISDELMEALPYFRVELGEEALHSADVNGSPVKVILYVNNLISNGELSIGTLIETFGFDRRKNAEYLYGEILKEQLRGFVNLLKILTEAGDEL